jgi:hypothetical protein
MPILKFQDVIDYIKLIINCVLMGGYVSRITAGNASELYFWLSMIGDSSRKALFGNLTPVFYLEIQQFTRKRELQFYVLAVSMFKRCDTNAAVARLF